MSHSGGPSTSGLADTLRSIGEHALELVALAESIDDERVDELRRAVLAACVTIGVELDSVADALAIDARHVR